MAASADPLDATLAVFDGADAPETPRTASEVADALDCTRRTAYNRLERLAERGDLRTKKVGARGRVWWRRAIRRSTGREARLSWELPTGA